MPEINTPQLREQLTKKVGDRRETQLNKFQHFTVIGSAVFGTIIGSIFGGSIGYKRRAL